MGLIETIGRCFNEECRETIVATDLFYIVPDKGPICQQCSLSSDEADLFEPSFLEVIECKACMFKWEPIIPKGNAVTSCPMCSAEHGLEIVDE